MMDWHYHKDDAPTKEETDWYDNVQAWQKAGFELFLSGGSLHTSTLTCPYCGCLVTEKTWRKHLKSLHAPSKNPYSHKAPR